MAYAAVYPNRHALGLANLGFQTLAALLGSLPGAFCHRAFADYPRTLEADRPLGAYDVVAFSISFELDYPGVLRLLREGEIPLRQEERSRAHPLVIGGGIAPTLNPEPVAPFFDALFLGEAEAGLAALHRFLVAHRGLHRPRLLEALADARLPGVYVPARYRVVESGPVVVERTALGRAPERIDRVWAAPPWEPARTHVTTPEDPFGGAFLLEVSRGCPHGCRFCAAGYATRPFRPLPLDRLEPLARYGARELGRVGLVGAAVSDHPGLPTLARAILSEGGSFTVSSFRVEALTPELLDLLVRGGLHTVTVALEAGTERLRRALGKGVELDHLTRAARLAGQAGLTRLRIYAMVGIPGEEDEDVDALAQAARAARDALGKGTVTLSVAPFVPKPHTPLQWEAMAPEQELRRRIRRLQSLTGRHRGLHTVAEAPKWARVQGLLARGGRRTARLLEEALDGRSWREILRSAEAAGALDRPRRPDAALPWGFVGGVPSTGHLLRERSRGRRGEPPLPCEPGACRVCGVCADFLKNRPPRADGTRTHPS
ncbi:MAG: radical SAM protein [Deferrisomatales bacterium]